MEISQNFQNIFLVLVAFHFVSLKLKKKSLEEIIHEEDFKMGITSTRTLSDCFNVFTVGFLVLVSSSAYNYYITSSLRKKNY